jgi:hypothetical protein
MLLLVGASLAAVGVLVRTQGHGAAARADGQVQVRFEKARPAGRVYEGRIKDARPAWGYLILAVGEGRQARHLTFDVRGARIVGPSGNEWKAQDLWDGDRVRIEMTQDGGLVRQITVLADR